MAAQAQFEKGKWILNPSITGLEFSHDTGTDKTSFGLEAKGGAFLLDNIALLVHAGAAWNTGGSDLDVYTLGVGGRYYFVQDWRVSGCRCQCGPLGLGTRFG